MSPDARRPTVLSMEIDTKQTEAIMQAATITDTTPRYGFQPQAMFAATRAGAERRRLETGAVTAVDSATHRSIRSLAHRLVALIGAL